MSKFVFGFIISLLLSLPLAKALFDSNPHLDLTLITNVVIALATVFATFIHFDSVKKQRADRIWEINKELLLDLQSLVIKAKDASEQEFNAIRNWEAHNSNVETYKKLNGQIDYALRVFSPLMPKDLIEKVKRYQKYLSEITRKWSEDDEFDMGDALEAQFEACVELEEELRKFITRMAGVKSLD